MALIGNGPRRADDRNGLEVSGFRLRCARAMAWIRAALMLLVYFVLLPGSVLASDDAPTTTSPVAPTASATSDPEPAPRVDQSLLRSFLVDHSVFTLIDARSPEEFEASHVDGAVNVPIDRVRRENPDLPRALEAPIVVYCKTGRRAAAVAEALAGLGYRDVRVLPSEQLMFQEGLVVFNCGS